jgi:hypothetical protein
MTIIGLRAAQRKLEILGMDAEVEKQMSPHPRRISRVSVELIVRLSGGDSSDREWIQEQALACPVALSLHPDIDQDVRISFA